jgi:hypothetical protein
MVGSIAVMACGSSITRGSGIVLLRHAPERILLLRAC